MYDQALYDKLLARCQPDPFTGCWIWTGFRYNWSKNKKRKHVGQYGQFSIRRDGKNRAIHAHRAMWISLHGPLERTQFVCHKCDNGLCVNPEHLFIGSAKDNARDMRMKVRDSNSQKTHCPRGHAYAEHGVRNTNGFLGWRNCAICVRARNRRKHGWPEHLWFLDIKVPSGYRLDRETGQIVPGKRSKAA